MKIKLNRYLWITVFLAGAVVMSTLHWQEEYHTFGWFLLTSLWSAFCAIGFSIFYWLTDFKK